MILFSPVIMGPWGQTPQLSDLPRVGMYSRDSIQRCSVDVRGADHPGAIAMDGSCQAGG